MEPRFRLLMTLGETLDSLPQGSCHRHRPWFSNCGLAVEPWLLSHPPSKWELLLSTFRGSLWLKFDCKPISLISKFHLLWSRDRIVMACRVPILDHVLGQVFSFGWRKEGNLTPNLPWIFSESSTTHQLLLFLFHAFSITGKWPSVGLVQHGAARVGSYKNLSKSVTLALGRTKKVLPSLISVFFLTFQFFYTKKSRDPKDSKKPLKFGSFSKLRDVIWFARTNMTMEKEPFEDVDVSENGGTQQSLVFLPKMIILGCFGGTTIYGNHRVSPIKKWCFSIVILVFGMWFPCSRHMENQFQVGGWKLLVAGWGWLGSCKLWLG